MSILKDVLAAVQAMAMQTNPYASIVFGSDPPTNGICIVPAGGMPAETYINKGTYNRMEILLNAKNADQMLAFDTLADIHAALTRTTDYPNTSDFQIINILTTASPALIGREQNSQWIYGSSLEVTFFWR